MNQTQAAVEIARRINSYSDFSAKVHAPSKSGTVEISVSTDSGGKRGWIPAGTITIGESIEISKETAFAFRYSKSEFAAVTAPVDYSFESPKPLDEASLKMLELSNAAKLFRNGRVVSDDLIVECVALGFLTQDEAMNRDF